LHQTNPTVRRGYDERMVAATKDALRELLRKSEWKE
jgi:hypothetical protein